MKDDEIRKCAANNIAFLELPLAYDGISVVVNRENSWAKNLTVAELKAIWEQSSRIQTWQDIRPEFPKVPLKLFSPGRDNGTYDYFTEAILGSPEANPRQDVVASTTPEILAQGINSAPGALGYFGLAYYVEHKDSLRLLAIDGGRGPVLPANDSVLDGSYTPLSRPLFIYVKASSLKRPEVRTFIRYCLREASRVAQAVGYIPLPSDLALFTLERLAKNTEGSIRSIGQPVGPLRTLLPK
jgi:phosphate transport system substrate-binding protein